MKVLNVRMRKGRALSTEAAALLCCLCNFRPRLLKLISGALWEMQWLSLPRPVDGERRVCCPQGYRARTLGGPTGTFSKASVWQGCCDQHLKPVVYTAEVPWVPILEAEPEVKVWAEPEVKVWAGPEIQAWAGPASDALRQDLLRALCTGPSCPVLTSGSFCIRLPLCPFSTFTRTRALVDKGPPS